MSDNCGMETLRDKLAAYAHLAWSGWMLYMFSKTSVGHDGAVTFPAEVMARWRRQARTDYADLPPNEQASDLLEADTILAIIGVPDPTAEALEEAAQAVRDGYFQMTIHVGCPEFEERLKRLDVALFAHRSAHQREEEK